jgi:hypothetical protein
MLRKLRPRRPSHATVVAYLGLFVALGGTAYAVNTVGSTDIIDGQVKSVDVGDNEIGSADVKDNSINTFDVHSFLGVDVVDNSLTGADIDESTLGVVQGTGKVLAGSGSVGFDQSGNLATVPNLGTFSMACSSGLAVTRFTPVSGLGAYKGWFDGNGNSGLVPYSFATATSPDELAFLLPSKSVVRLRIVSGGALMATLQLDVNQAGSGQACDHSFQVLATS